MTYVVVGAESKKIYVEAKTKNECWRLLQKKYPVGKIYKSRSTGARLAHIYPETLLITRRG